MERRPKTDLQMGRLKFKCWRVQFWPRASWRWDFLQDLSAQSDPWRGVGRRPQMEAPEAGSWQELGPSSVLPSATRVCLQTQRGSP